MLDLDTAQPSESATVFKTVAVMVVVDLLKSCGAQSAVTVPSTGDVARMHFSLPRA